MVEKKVREPARKVVGEEDAGQRVDRWLKRVFAEVPYVGLQKLIRQGRVRVNGVKCKGDARLAAGDVVSFPPDVAKVGAVAGKGAFQASERDVRMVEEATVFEDKWLLVLNKPAGLPAQAGGGQVRSLDRILAAMYGEDKAPKLVHRLDRETTGLIVCAKNRSTAAALGEQFAGREVEKIYMALVAGKLPGGKGEIRRPIKKAGAFARIAADGDKAHTSWELLAEVGEGLHLLACTPHTGRMNQLRVHFADAGWPIVGDDKYAFDVAQAAGRKLHAKGAIPLYLHAWKLVLRHPQSGEIVRLEAKLPPHLAALTDKGLRDTIGAM